MAVNPAEDIVNVWLQDKGYFTQQNIVVPKKGGSRGKEIDILAINPQGDKIWVEVTVSPRPRKQLAREQVDKIVELAKNKFHREKEERVRNIFRSKRFRKMFVYTPTIFSYQEEKAIIFKKRLERLHIEVVDFRDVFAQAVKDINHYSVDPIKIQLYYIQRLFKEKEPKQTKA